MSVPHSHASRLSRQPLTTCLAHSPVHLIGHYIRQEDFDQDPYSDSDNSEYDSNDEDIPSDFEEDESASDLEGMSGLIADGSDDGEDGARFEELKQEIAKHDEAAKS